MAHDNVPDTTSYQSDYSETRLGQKLARFGRRGGRQLALKILQLYYVLQRPDVPLWAKTTIIGALGYFISPLDAIPDLLPGVGYADDASAIGAALVTVAMYIDDDVCERAEHALSRWWKQS
ncbi:YkvA family protein [Halomonas sp. WWR20]